MKKAALITGGTRGIGLGIARALASDPAIFLADEPTGNLDTATGKQIMEILKNLNEQGKTIVMVTHEAHIAAYARRRIHMVDGNVASVEEEGASQCAG